MYQRRAGDPSYCACCATDVVQGQLVWAGLVYDTSVVVCNLACLHTLVTRWAKAGACRVWWRCMRRVWRQR